MLSPFFASKFRELFFRSSPVSFIVFRNSRALGADFILGIDAHDRRERTSEAAPDLAP